MNKLIFTGCSFTAGTGWDQDDPGRDDKNHPDLWVNLCHQHIPQLQELDLINCGEAGATNTEIFTNTINIISSLHEEIEVCFCNWSAWFRYNYTVGLELWSTDDGMDVVSTLTHDINLSDGTTWPRWYLNNLRDRLIVLHHPHWEILKIVKYCNILQKIAKFFDIKLYFINGLCPWDKNYFVRLENVMPEDYTPYTRQEILQIEHRADDDIFKLYNKIHNDYAQAGGIDPSQWVNLYDSLHANRIDVNYDGGHPGKKSNQIYFQQVKKFLESQSSN